MITNAIACFHMDLGSKEHDQVVGLWQSVWEKHGWKTQVLTLADAQRNSMFNELWFKASEFPTVNNRDFERACFIRWCAFSLWDGAISDSDVLPRISYPPREYITPYTADPCGGPGLMVGTRSDYERIIHSILVYRQKASDVSLGKPHVSDLTILQHDKYFQRHNDIACYGVDGWRDKPLTHFGNAYLKGLTGTKLERIVKILKEEGAPHV